MAGISADDDNAWTTSGARHMHMSIMHATANLGRSSLFQRCSQDGTDERRREDQAKLAENWERPEDAFPTIGNPSPTTLSESEPEPEPKHAHIHNHRHTHIHMHIHMHTCLAKQEGRRRRQRHVTDQVQNTPTPIGLLRIALRRTQPHRQ